MATDVMAAAAGQWPRLLIELAGLAPEQLENRHQPCPACGGTDRYRWDRDDGPGGWFCNQCGGRDQRGGGGSGMDLLLRLTGWDFATAARRIEAHLALPAGQAAAPPVPVPQKPASPARKAGRPARIPGTPPPDAPPPELGRASGQWCYTDAAGAPLFWVQRLDLLQGGRQRKVFVQRTWLDGGWHFPSRRDPFRSDWPAPRPLYRLAELERHFWAPVLITEGEKAADAAAALFPDHVVVSWCGGSQAIASVDWSPLAGRAVSLWPDADAAGRSAMAALSGVLLPIVDALFVVLPPEPTPDPDGAEIPALPEGWDLADADWSPQQALAFLETHSRPVRQEEPNPLLPEPENGEVGADASAPDAAVELLPVVSGQRPCRRSASKTGRGSHAGRPVPAARHLASAGAALAPGTPASSGPEPFSCLGYDTDGYYYQPSSTGQVLRLAASSHGGMNLCRLAPVAYWEALYPSRSGVNWTAAASDLFSRQAAVGMFDPDRLRGRGTWWDRGRCVLHLGDRLVIDGVRQAITDPLEMPYHLNGPKRRRRYDEDYKAAVATRVVVEGLGTNLRDFAAAQVGAQALPSKTAARWEPLGTFWHQAPIAHSPGAARRSHPPMKPYPACPTGPPSPAGSLKISPALMAQHTRLHRRLLGKRRRRSSPSPSRWTPVASACPRRTRSCSRGTRLSLATAAGSRLRRATPRAHRGAGGRRGRNQPRRRSLGESCTAQEANRLGLRCRGAEGDGGDAGDCVTAWV